MIVGDNRGGTIHDFYGFGYSTVSAGTDGLLIYFYLQNLTADKNAKFIQLHHIEF